MCIDAMLFDDHNCKSGKYMSNCPICQEDLFSSRFASHEMPCGHAIHWHCFKELTSYDTRCPVCKKTAESPEQMAATWSAIAMGIALQPVPPEMARVVSILCNDCESSDTNRRWHFLGVRCRHCFSFNTNVEQILMQGRDAAAYLDDVEEIGNAVDGAGGVPANITMPSTALAGLAATIANVGNRYPSENTMDEDAPSAQEASATSSDLQDTP
jgi:Zinc-ribbon/Ring finger domain